MKENCIKYVIAKTTGPTYKDKHCLTIGKSYEVIHISYQIINSSGAFEWVNDEFKYDYMRDNFYLYIKEDDNGIPQSIWNKFFYNVVELRNDVINQILL